MIQIALKEVLENKYVSHTTSDLVVSTVSKDPIAKTTNHLEVMDQATSSQQKDDFDVKLDV